MIFVNLIPKTDSPVELIDGDCHKFILLKYDPWAEMTQPNDIRLISLLTQFE